MCSLFKTTFLQQLTDPYNLFDRQQALPGTPEGQDMTVKDRSLHPLPPRSE